MQGLEGAGGGLSTQNAIGASTEVSGNGHNRGKSILIYYLT